MAERGKGAFLNDQRIRVAAGTARRSRRRLRAAAPGRGDLALDAQEIAAAQAAFRGVAPLRRRHPRSRLGGAGRLDAYWERDLSPWDMAAGIAPGARGRRFRHRSRRRRRDNGQGRRRGRQRDDAPRAPSPPEGGRERSRQRRGERPPETTASTLVRRRRP